MSVVVGIVFNWPSGGDQLGDVDSGSTSMFMKVVGQLLEVVGEVGGLNESLVEVNFALLDISGFLFSLDVLFGFLFVVEFVGTSHFIDTRVVNDIL